MTEIKRGPADYLAETVLAYIRENAELRAENDKLLSQLPLRPLVLDSNKYPPVQPEELESCLSFENLDRVVVTKNRVYGRMPDGHWISLEPYRIKP